MYIIPIKSKDACEFVLKWHYSNRKPNMKYCYGYFNDNFELKGVIIYGLPATPSIQKNIIKGGYSNVLEITRIVNLDKTFKTSKFLASTLSSIKDKGNFIIVSYADTSMGHIGTIYKATNFIYTGKTKQRTDIYSKNHARHAKIIKKQTKRKIRSAKHRYVKFIGDKKFIRKCKKLFTYSIVLYEKGISKRYKVGEYKLKEEIISI